MYRELSIALSNIVDTQLERSQIVMFICFTSTLQIHLVAYVMQNDCNYY